MYFFQPGLSSLFPQADSIPRAEQPFATGDHIPGFSSDFKDSHNNILHTSIAKFPLNLNYSLVSAIAWSISIGALKRPILLRVIKRASTRKVKKKKRNNYQIQF